VVEMTTTAGVSGVLEADDVLDLMDTEPVQLVETDDVEDAQRAAAHFGPEEPHDDADVLVDVEVEP
jgi:hypothetical protein